MEYVLAVFSIRTDTIQFNKVLTKNKIYNSVIETPKSASSSCGLSVKFALKDLPKARQLLIVSGAKSFVRFYRISGMYGNVRLTPL